MPTNTVTEQFAAEYARNAVPAMLKAINSIKRYNRFVLLGALLTSYLHQAHYLWTQGASYFAYLVPLIFDAAMVSMLTVVRTSGIAKDAKRGALIVFAAAALLSATINFASPGSLGLRLVFALVVVLVIGVELVAGRIRPDFAAIEAEAAALLNAANNLKAKAEPEPAPVAPPAPAPDTEHPTAPTPVAEPVPAPISAVTLPPTLAMTAADPATPVDETPSIPQHLVPTARFAAAQHLQATGHRISPDGLAARLNISPAVAGALLTVVDPDAPAVNGHHLTGDRR
ncbi:DUF2637 domain-containing protein [Solwaraspora sp. WMMB762]|uniref:DUF2637 domain-containing protein n=1 Tax=Solwaraspora sp. WMMB762 TaxID=3404120 RepID=UPI003B939292